MSLTQLARRNSLRVVGLMSGTSADGVDAAIVDIAPGRARVLAFATFPYPAWLRREVLRLCTGGGAGVEDVCHLNFVLGEAFADAVIKLARKARIPLASIDLIGSHGQTIRHIPDGRAARLAGRRRIVRSTLQIAEPSIIAERTGITTVADFRPRDIAAGGQGAPLVPYADLVLFDHRKKARAIQNIGGIANVTYLPAGARIDDVLAFDTGPGNMIIDHLAGLATAGRLKYDAGGRMAARGKVNQALLAELMRHRFLKRRPPKTTGREEFGAAFADRLWRRARLRGLPREDILATATAFTAVSIADAYWRFLPGPVDEVILCGGGAWNNTLVRMLREALSGAPNETAVGGGARVLRTDDLGVSADAKEAVSFAILAYQTIHGRPGNVPGATGASHPAVLGKIVPGR
ncbi:MAG: anhydro-N-acetylmuramic acid kinase [Phycisphaerae bacterium]